MAAGNLFGAVCGSSKASKKNERGGVPRLVRPSRHQLRLESRRLDKLIPADPRARTWWLASERLDLAAFYDEIESVESGPGRPAIDPRVLLVLWLYATAEGVGSARRLSRLCQEHDAYRWITGGLRVCHRVLSDFRVAHRKDVSRCAMVGDRGWHGWAAKLGDSWFRGEVELFDEGRESEARAWLDRAATTEAGPRPR